MENDFYKDIDWSIIPSAILNDPYLLNTEILRQKKIKMFEKKKGDQCMKETTCWECKYHEVFFDEQYDGCVCHNRKATEKNHTENCIEYVTNDNYKECPYFELKESD